MKRMRFDTISRWDSPHGSPNVKLTVDLTDGGFGELIIPVAKLRQILNGLAGTVATLSARPDKSGLIEQVAIPVKKGGVLANPGDDLLILYVEDIYDLRYAFGVKQQVAEKIIADLQKALPGLRKPGTPTN